MPATSEARTSCKTCGAPLVFDNTRARIRKKFCSKACHAHDQRGRRAIPIYREARVCAVCGIDYVANQKKQKYCSQRCTQKITGPRWRRGRTDLKFHLKRLLQYSERSNFLTLDFLIELFEKQGGRCSLTGMQMTWGMGKGRVPTHISIDRIRSFEGYSPENVQLVCRVANLMKLDMGQADFVDICRKIVDMADAGHL